MNFPTWFKVAYCWLFILFWRKVIFFLYFMLSLWNSLFSNPFCDYLASYSRRASTCSGNMFGPAVPAPHKKRSIPNMDKRGSTASGSGLYGLVIPPKVTKVSHLHHYFILHVCQIIQQSEYKMSWNWTQQKVKESHSTLVPFFTKTKSSKTETAISN